MPEAVTLDEVWKLFKETDRIFRERTAETDRLFREMSAETDRRFKETDRRFKETDRQFKETDRQFKETGRQFKETDRQFKESARQLKETERAVKEVSRQLGDLGGKWGRFIENMVAPACETLFAARGIPVHQVHQRVRNRRDDGSAMEVDILVVNTDVAVLVEVKSRLEVADIKEHLQRLSRFKEFFPRYADCRVMGAVAGIEADDGAHAFAAKQGLFVLVQAGEAMRLDNAADFQPCAW